MTRLTSLLAASLFLLVFLPGSHAGDAANPEITDPDDDRELQGTITLSDLDAAAAISESTELVSAWVVELDEDTLEFWVHPKAGPATTNNVNGVVTLYDHIYDFHFEVGGSSYTATMEVDQVDGVLTGGVTDSGRIDTTVGAAVMTVLRADIGSPAVGSQISGMYVDATSEVAYDDDYATITDRAPDSGTSPNTYTLTQGEGGADPNDEDGDGLNDTWENDNFGNTTQGPTDDPDADGCDNQCESGNGTDPNNPDTDGDGINDGDEINDGTDPLDADDPGIGEDTDGDGLADSWENEHFGNLTQNGTMDPDGDSCDNLCEQEHGSDPNVADTDEDGLDDGDETTRGTDPTDPDTDGDGFDDGEEVRAGTDPLDPADFPRDDDNDGLPDQWEEANFGNLTQNGTMDPDDDGCDNLCEYENGTDPTDPDTDDDGSLDGEEVLNGTNPNDAEDFEKPAGDNFLDKLTADPGYLGASAGGMFAVLIISVIALFVRWA